MQIINHKNSELTVCQKFFIEKSVELLHLRSIDSYRVRLNNSKSIFEELKYCLNEFKIGRIKHFHTIKAKDKKNAIINEAITLLESHPNYLEFNSISNKYLKKLLEEIDESAYKRVVSAIDVLLTENSNYLENIINGLASLIAGNDTTLEKLEAIDQTLNSLITELINNGFSKSFLFKLVYGIFFDSQKTGASFEQQFEVFKKRILSAPSDYEIVFRIDTTQKVYDSISVIKSDEIELSDTVDGVVLTKKNEAELNVFNIPAKGRKFIKCKIEAKDYLAALKKARSILSEYLDVINLGLADEVLLIHTRVLVIDTRFPDKAGFQNNVNMLDGKYKVEKVHYWEFTKKLPSILNSSEVQRETKEKIKSAIRYLRLGNQSTEVEHKFINYWIGLEYLFSNYESQSTINRIKEHFINADLLAYVKRNTYSFKKDFERISKNSQLSIKSYTPSDNTCLADSTFYKEISDNLSGEYPLLAYRASKLSKWFFPKKGEPNATDYLEKHKKNLEVHFTRIYRLRNEIIHDAATNTNNEHIASNLRYYLTFILNELIDFFARNAGHEISIEDYFILSELEIGNIALNGYKLNELLNVDCSIDFIF